MTSLLELVHIVVRNPLCVVKSDGFQLHMLSPKKLSEYMNIYLIRMKYETFEKFKDFQDEVQNHCNKNINSL